MTQQNPASRVEMNAKFRQLAANLMNRIARGVDTKIVAEQPPGTFVVLPLGSVRGDTVFRAEPEKVLGCYDSDSRLDDLVEDLAWWHQQRGAA